MSWPSDYSGSWTLAASVTRSGTGLHSGAVARVRLEPSDRPGLAVAFADAPAAPPLPLHPDQVQQTTLCTALGFADGRRLATVEHLLAALAGCGITQAVVRIDGEEIPLLDGSALGWVEAIGEAGLVPVPGTPRRPRPDRPITLQLGQSFVTALPSDTLLVGAAIDFPQGAIGRQMVHLPLTPERFVAEVAPARTFGFRDQIEQLRDAGLIAGGSLDNALVCDGDRWLNPPLRYPDEPVRHKLLDLLGDLALVGLPHAQVFAFRGSHALHTSLAAALADRAPD